MKTFDLNQLGVEELNSVELTENQGGTYGGGGLLSGGLLNLGSAHTSDVADVNPMVNLHFSGNNFLNFTNSGGSCGCGH